MSGANDASADAVRLTVAIGRLRSRLREEAGTTSTGLSVTQLAVLQRIRDEGATTASALASAEHVSQQAIAQNLKLLKTEGLTSTEPDPSDARKSLISVTETGRKLLDTILASRDAWLVAAIEEAVPAAERADLGKAIELLERLASLDSLPPRRR